MVMTGAINIGCPSSLDFNVEDTPQAIAIEEAEPKDSSIRVPKAS